MRDPNQKPIQNKNPFNFYEKLKYFFGSANSDSDKEFIGQDEENGIRIDGLNGRMASNEGGTGAFEKIKGEVLLYDMTGILNSSYYCICAVEVGGYLFCAWASDLPGFNAPAITLNDQLVCQSDKLLFAYTNHLKIDINNNELGGEIYIVDNLNVPIYFSIKDLWDSRTTQKYFSLFIRALYEVNLQLPPDNIVFDQLVPVGAGGGVPTGGYSYRHHYVSNQGDASGWSPFTPTINVPNHYVSQDAADAAYPFLNTQGRDADPTLNGGLGVQLRFRINNYLNYDYIEIQRIAYNSGAGIGYTPEPFIIFRLKLTPAQFGVYTFIDSVSNENTLVASTIEAQSGLASIKTANSIRYFYNKVVLGCITYNSREVKPTDFSFIKNAGVTKVAPFVKDIGKIGCKGDFFSTYNQPYMNSEAYGFEIVFWDSQFFKSFATPIPNLTNYIFPNRRDKMTDAYSLSNSTGAVNCAVLDNSIGKCFECVDYTDLIAKPFSQISPYINPSRNILNADDKSLLFTSSTANSGSGDGKWLNNESYFFFQTPNKYGFLPSYPAFVGDTRDNYNDFPVNDTFVEYDSIGSGSAPVSPRIFTTKSPYSPSMFAPRYNSLGLAIAGLNSWPDWATSFSIVRTQRAGRVVCQGLAFYSLIDYLASNQTLVGRQPITPPTGPYGTDDFIGYDCKKKDTFTLHLPDFDNGNLDPFILEDIKQNPSDYSIQIVAPFGLGSEITAKELVADPAQDGTNTNSDPFQKADIAAYARVMGEWDSNDKRINPTLSASIWGFPYNTFDSYVGFGKWRNTSVPSFGGQTAGQHLFQISSLTDNQNNVPGTNVFELKLTENIYTSSLFYYEGPDYQDFTEPVYIINIVRTGAVAPTNSNQSLVQTGTYIKIESLVGISDGVASRYEMCGERVEDFCSFYSQSDDNFIWVDVLNNGNKVRYIDITYKTPAEITTITAAIAANTPYNGNLIYGTYTIDLVTVLYANGQNLPIFINISPAFIPSNECKIYVKYDNRYAIKVFGGDAFVGEATAPIVNRTAGEDHNNTAAQFGPGGGVSGSGPLGDLACVAGFPYNNSQISRSVIIARKVDAVSKNSQDCIPAQNSITFDNTTIYASIRQLICMYTCQCYFPLQLDYSDRFPLVAYVQRPYQYDTNLKPSAQHIFLDYETLYPDEQASWQYGGFHVGSTQVSTDYMKSTKHDVYIQNGGVGFRENTYFPNRVIWSLTRPIEVYSSPNLKSFNALNIFDTSDQYGRINLLYSCISDIGENLYAFCDDNICELLTRKRTLVDLNGVSVAQMGVTDNQFITEQKWRGDRRIGGLPDDFWKSFAENGSEAFFFNRNSVYKFINGTIIDLLSKYKYYNRVKNSLIKRLSNPIYADNIGIQSTVGIYDKKKEEYLFGGSFNERRIFIEAGASTYSILIASPQYQQYNQYDIANIHLPAGVVFPFYVLVTISDEFPFAFIKNTGRSPFGIKDPTGSILIDSVLSGQIVQVFYGLNGVYTGRLIDDKLACRDNYLFSFVNKEQISGFNGVFDYNFERYISSYDARNLYGVKDQSIFSLDCGYIVNGESIVYQAIQSATPIPDKSVEFARIRISSDKKPTNVYFFNKEDILVSISTLDGANLKNYDAFENYIPRRGDTKNRFENEFLTYKIEHNLKSDFRIVFTGIQYKIIK